MRWIHARTADWHSGNPNVQVSVWLAMFLAAAVIYVLAIGSIGSLVNSDATAFLH